MENNDKQSETKRNNKAFVILSALILVVAYYIYTLLRR